MAAAKHPAKNADEVIFAVLLYEFHRGAAATADRRIRQRLRYHGLGPVEQSHVDRLRRLRDEVVDEVGRGTQSRYYLGARGPYAELEDFDIERMTTDWAKTYPEVQREALAGFITGAVYLWYMR